MNERNEILKILKEEYGIKDSRDLLSRLNSLGNLDVSMFCGEPKRQELRHGKGRVFDKTDGERRKMA